MNKENEIINFTQVAMPVGTFKIGDTVRLKDGDGREHTIKSFERQEGVHGPDFYIVHFEDDSATGFLHPKFTDMETVARPNGVPEDFRKVVADIILQLAFNRLVAPEASLPSQDSVDAASKYLWDLAKRLLLKSATETADKEMKLNMPQWRIAEYDMCSDLLQWAVIYDHDGGDSENWKEVIPTCRVKEGEKYFEIDDLLKLL